MAQGVFDQRTKDHGDRCFVVAMHLGVVQVVDQASNNDVVGVQDVDADTVRGIPDD